MGEDTINEQYNIKSKLQKGISYESIILGKRSLIKKNMSHYFRWIGFDIIDWKHCGIINTTIKNFEMEAETVVDVFKTLLMV